MSLLRIFRAIQNGCCVLNINTRNVELALTFDYVDDAFRFKRELERELSPRLFPDVNAAGNWESFELCDMKVKLHVRYQRSDTNSVGQRIDQLYERIQKHEDDIARIIADREKKP